MELGRRLRELRRRAGLNQTELARLMGRNGRGADTVVGRLERGQCRYPSLGLMADFLRGCRAGFSDVADILDEYAARPVAPVREGRLAVLGLVARLPVAVQCQVTKYDTKTILARERDEGSKGDTIPEGKRIALALEPLEKRVRRVRNMARALLLRERLEERLHRCLGEPGMPASLSAWHALARFGREAFSILCRTRGGEDSGVLSCVRAMNRAEEEGAPTEGVARVNAAADRLFTELEQSGELDRVPEVSPEEIAAGRLLRPGVKRVEQMRKAEDKARLEEYFRNREYVRAAISLDVNRRLVAEGMPDEQRLRRLSLVGRLAGLALEAGDDAERWRAAVDWCTRGAEQPGLIEQSAEEVRGLYVKHRHKIPPDPRVESDRNR